ncbi:signal recognition particle-docking protein FtsY [bacterium endosymbiont of Pedicinus badii]|uniref:signal recognition particle-docking protein FtsY n=1 Tax=bacterium endosymbiont of Pedicinus badii TaxID=1719126 RepID=UPI0018A82F62|nr:signal recognition particle-docking protein FtsY [bacterium endosymbiont of Pedicinus badii]
MKKNNILKKIKSIVKKEYFVNTKKYFFSKKNQIFKKIKNLFFSTKNTTELIKKLQYTLISFDVGIQTTDKIIKKILKKVDKDKISENSKILDILQKEMLNIICKKSVNLLSKKKNSTFLFVGNNGVGKTTTIGKLAKNFSKKGKKIMLVAADTRRPASIKQLKSFETEDIFVFFKDNYKDASAVIFDAIKSNRFSEFDFIMIDTAGRFQNKKELSLELKKIIKTLKKIHPFYPEEVILVIDACSGQNTINQVKLFNKEIKVTSIIITKLDGSAKGGIIFPISDIFKIPIQYICNGRKINDLKSFNPNEFIQEILPKDIH